MPKEIKSLVSNQLWAKYGCCSTVITHNPLNTVFARAYSILRENCKPWDKYEFDSELFRLLADKGQPNKHKIAVLKSAFKCCTVHNLDCTTNLGEDREDRKNNDNLLAMALDIWKLFIHYKLTPIDYDRIIANVRTTDSHDFTYNNKKSLALNNLKEAIEIYIHQKAILDL